MAVICREDPVFRYLQDQPEEEDGGYAPWVSANAKTKKTIILWLSESALQKTHELADGYRTAKEFWDELECIYTMLSTKAIDNPHTNIESISFKDGEDFDKHVSKCLSILDKFSEQYQVLSNADKVTKIISTLPESFDSLEMVSLLNENTFKQTVNAGQANKERKKKLGTWKTSSSSAGTSSNLVDGNKFSTNNINRGRGRRRRRGRGRANRGRKGGN